MITLTPLSQLNSTDVAANLAAMIQLIQEGNPTLDIRRGVFADLLVYWNAVLATQRQANIQDYLNGRSLAAITAAPGVADPDLVDDVLSNFGIVRQPGTIATGDVTVIVSQDVTAIIGQGAIWTANGQTFQTLTAFTAKAQAEQINTSTDRLLTATANGNWAFTITVTATAPGSAWNLSKDTTLVPSNPLPNLVNAYATSDIAGGTDTETNQQLLTRLQLGIAAKTLGNRINMQALLRQIPAFTAIVNTAILGYGDVEMLRDRHSILPISSGGRVDWYVRSQELLAKTLVVKTATLVAKIGAVGTWQISLNRDEAAGIYEVANIRLVNSGAASGGFTLVSDTRALDLTGTAFIPDIVTAIEGAYSRYQTIIIQFTDTVTNVITLVLGSQQDYELEIRGVPLIASIQDTLNARSMQSVGTDLLVKAPMPCFITLNFTINTRNTDAAPDLVSITNALCTLINNVGFVGQVSASQIQDVIHSYLTSGQTVTGVDILGRLRYPDASIHYVRSGEVLLISSDIPNMISTRTVQFFLAPTDIGITVTTTIPSGI